MRTNELKSPLRNCVSRNKRFLNAMFCKETAMSLVKGLSTKVLAFTVCCSTILATNICDANAATPKTIHSSYDDGVYDYIIITSSSLSSSFARLANWKTMKGVKTKVITIEEISSQYSGKTLKEKIQACIKSYKSKLPVSHLYVMIGGDATIVPAGNETSNNLQGTNIYGESDVPYVCEKRPYEKNVIAYISRALVTTTTDASTFVSKVISYEKNPVGNGWDKMLFIGSETGEYDNNTSSISSSQKKCENMYSNIQTYWSRVNRKNAEFCFDADASCAVLSNKIKDGYSFINIYTEGNSVENSSSSGYLNFVTNGSKYSYGNARSQKQTNAQPTILISQASYFAKFNRNSIMKVLLCNANSGVVAGIGSSTQVVNLLSDYEDISYEPFHVFDVHLYYELFNSTGFKNAAKILTEAKLKTHYDLFNINKQDYYSNTLDLDIYGPAYAPIEWYNLIGDAEMPIYTHAPKNQDDIILIQSENSTTATIKCGSYNFDCRICVMSADDNGASYYKVIDNANYATTFSNVPKHYNVTVSRPGYATWTKTIDHRVLPVIESVKCDNLDNKISITCSKGEFSDVRLEIRQNGYCRVCKTLADSKETFDFDIASWSKGACNITLEFGNNERVTKTVNLDHRGQNAYLDVRVDDNSNMYACYRFSASSSTQCGILKVIKDSDFSKSGPSGTSVETRNVDGRQLSTSFYCRNWESGFYYVVLIEESQPPVIKTFYLDNEKPLLKLYCNIKSCNLEASYRLSSSTKDASIEMTYLGTSNPDAEMTFYSQPINMSKGRESTAKLDFSTMVEGEYKVALVEDGKVTKESTVILEKPGDIYDIKISSNEASFSYKLHEGVQDAYVKIADFNTSNSNIGDTGNLVKGAEPKVSKTFVKGERYIFMLIVNNKIVRTKTILYN